MKCRHKIGERECGATIQAPATQCAQCGGKACPKCSTSVVKELRYCLSCGWKLQTGLKFLIIDRNFCEKNRIILKLISCICTCISRMLGICHLNSNTNNQKMSRLQ